MFYKNKKVTSYIQIFLILFLVNFQLFSLDNQQELSKNDINILQENNSANLKKHVKYKNIIFDMGNVLVSWEPTKIAADICAKNKDLKFDINGLLELVSSNNWKKWDRGLITRKDIESSIPTSLDLNAVKLFLDVMPLQVTIEENINILKTVKALGYKVYILSNVSKENLEIMKQVYDFFKLFDGAVFSNEVQEAKPDIAVYQIFLKKYNLNPSECLFIDDVQKNIDVANLVGIDGIVCTDSNFLKAELKRLQIID
ncbi:HAD family phosphatase [Candidatus Babeliales bacterium]|nr:HAD family phosphatase [Candidatus Babeliales bacterium]MCF7899784.1 HAD family phosphatase [Candidatus Babeliales bacterium]